MEGSSETAEAEVGSLGWLGFFIVNVALWGVIAQSSSIAWVVGFIICGIYTGGLYFIATWLERRNNGKERYRQFLNLLWVLVCTFVFVMGMFIAVQVIGGRGMIEPFPSWSYDEGSLPDVLPSGASEELKAWARPQWDGGSNQGEGSGAMPIKFADNLYTVGKLEDDKSHAKLLRVDASLNVSAMLSDVDTPVFGPRGFTETSSGLLFFANGIPSSADHRFTTEHDRLYRVDVSSPGTAGSAITPDDVYEITTSRSPPGDHGQQFPRMVAMFEEDNQLYLKGTYPCRELYPEFKDSECWVDVYTIWKIDEIGAGQVAGQDLRGDVCTPGCTARKEQEEQGGPTTRELWGILFAAILPMMGVSWLVLISRQMPGPIVNIWVGGQLIIVILFELLDGESLTGGFLNSIKELYFRDNFLLMFVTFYNTVAYAAIIAWSLIGKDLPDWQEDIKTWAIFFVAWATFGLIHINLSVPWDATNVEWIVYAALAVVQFALGFIIRRSAPYATGAVCFFVISVKIATEITQQPLCLMIIFLAEGSLIIWGASKISSSVPEHED